MRRLHAILSLVLALALVAGATIHGARAAAMAAPMAMEWSAVAAQACDLCGGNTAEAAGRCALVCAGLTGIVVDSALLRDGLGGRPVAAAPVTIAGRFAEPEPDPPR